MDSGSLPEQDNGYPTTITIALQGTPKEKRALPNGQLFTYVSKHNHQFHAPGRVTTLPAIFLSQGK